MSSDIVDIDRALAGDLWVVKKLNSQRNFNKMVGSLVNDHEDDEWVKGPAKMNGSLS
jgi:hypothetical protein